MKKFLVILTIFTVITALILAIGCARTPTGAETIATQTAVANVNATATEVSLIATAGPTIPNSELVSVPGGTFTQTDASQTSYFFNHTVSSFKIGKYEVTYDLWYTVYQWAIVHNYTFLHAGLEGIGYGGTVGGAPTAAKYQPVTKVSWRDAVVWCNAYSEKTGRTPCYTYLGSVIKDSSDATACDGAVCAWENNGFRLPSEGEWQYAASYINGTSWKPYNYASGASADYTDATATGLVAWYDTNSGGTSHVVGSKEANALGIYDMSGNMSEWCWDWQGSYPTTAAANFRGPISTSGSYRALRGGNGGYSAQHLQVGLRYVYWPIDDSNINGFRLARSY